MLQDMKADGRKRGPKQSTWQRMRREQELANCRAAAEIGMCSQTMLADAMRVTQQAVSKRLRGRAITPEMVDSISDMVGRFWRRKRTTSHNVDRYAHISDAEFEAMLA
jgi:hypothetical protein